MKKPLVIAITGPTASGKSALAVELALSLQTEIISADSRQIYKGIPIVTAVPSEAEKMGVSHHLLECLELEDYYSASRFAEDSIRILKEIFNQNKVAIVCGGSMLYLDALIDGIDDLPTVPDNIRQTLMLEWKKNGNNWLLAKLQELDTDYYSKIDHRNLKRVFHAVEVSFTAGKPYSSLLAKEKPQREFDVLKICLTGNRELLFRRINSRVLNMVEKGLEEEARSVYHLRHLNALNTVGLKEMFSWFDGLLTKEEAIARIQKNTRVYAKKQETWHKRDKKAVRLDFASPHDILKREILDLAKSHIS